MVMEHSGEGENVIVNWVLKEDLSDKVTSDSNPAWGEG